MIFPEYIRDLSILSILLRFGVAVLLGGVIGWSRGRKHHAAGLRTHLLVCIGATSVMIVNQYLYEQTGVGDTARLGAQVISGIGFLGAGTILVQKGQNKISGLTTAAGLWTSACLGLTIGAGFLEAALIMFLVMYFALVTMNYLDDHFIKSNTSVSLYLELNQSTPFSVVLSCIRSNQFHVLEMKQLQATSNSVIPFQLWLQSTHKNECGDIVKELRHVPGISYVENL